MENLSFRQFWAQCFKDAFSKGWKTGGIVNAVLSLIVPFAHFLDAHSGQHLAQWTWVGAYSVALATLGATWLVVAGRLLIYAPYKVFLEAQSRHLVATRDLHKQIGDKEVRLLEYDATRQKKLDIQAFVKSWIALYEEGQSLDFEAQQSNPIDSETLVKIVDWQRRVSARLEHEIHDAAFLRYKNIKGVMAPAFDAYQRERFLRTLLPGQLEFLHEVIQSPSSFMLPS